MEDPTAPLQEQGNTEERLREKRLEKEADSANFNIILHTCKNCSEVKHHKMLWRSVQVSVGYAEGGKVGGGINFHVSMHKIKNK